MRLSTSGVCPRSAPARHAAAPSPRSSTRDTVLVVADSPIRDAVSDVARDGGYDVVVATTPLAAVHNLVRHGDRIAYAILASLPVWAHGLRELLAEEFPDVPLLTLLA